jgi:hypothetical protein
MNFCFREIMQYSITARMGGALLFWGRVKLYVCGTGYLDFLVQFLRI